MTRNDIKKWINAWLDEGSLTLKQEQFCTMLHDRLEKGFPVTEGQEKIFLIIYREKEEC